MSILEMNRFPKLGQPPNKLIPEMELNQISQDTELGQLKNISVRNLPPRKLTGEISPIKLSQSEFGQSVLLRSINTPINLLDEGVSTEITDKYKLHYIEKIHHFKNTLIKSVGHELKTPLFYSI